MQNWNRNAEDFADYKQTIWIKKNSNSEEHTEYTYREQLT